jgi:hypothetical protein
MTTLTSVDAAILVSSLWVQHERHARENAETAFLSKDEEEGGERGERARFNVYCLEAVETLELYACVCVYHTGKPDLVIQREEKDDHTWIQRVQKTLDEKSKKSGFFLICILNQSDALVIHVFDPYPVRLLCVDFGCILVIAYDHRSAFFT